MTAETTQLINVPTVPPPQRHALIFATFDALPVNGAFELVNDHDPVPLYFQFERTRTGQFSWKYLENGPARWHVRIGRVAAGPGGAPTGSCGSGSGGGGCGCGGR
jgi:uncharacterized protein (DUF2249 family)